MKPESARQAEIERHRLRSAEMREMIREAAEGMAAAGMDRVYSIAPELVHQRRIWAGYPDRRTLTGKLLGDPIPERSAWWGRRMEAAQ